MIKKLFKPAVIAVALSTTLVSGSLMAKTGESRLTPTIKGWAPYLPSVGTQVIGHADGTTKPLKIGDVVEVPTYLINSKFYTYGDGNDAQDLDADNDKRVRPGQHKATVGGSEVAQKVTVLWYVVEAKQGAGAKVWAPEGTTIEDYKDASLNTNWITSWDDIIATPVSAESYNMPSQGTKSLAVKVPVEASGKRIGFIIVPESQTGDPFRGQPLKVPDLNYIWEQEKPQGPGDQCKLDDVSNPDFISKLDDCLIDPTDPDKGNLPPVPKDENFGNGGGDVVKADYIVTIHYLPPGQEKANPGTDPILGTQAHPNPLVNSTYYADIQVLGSEADPDAPPKYRDLNNTNLVDGTGEVDSITWNFYRGDLEQNQLDNLPSTPEGQAQRDGLFTDNFIAKAVQGDATARTGTVVDEGGREYFSFKTQVDNDEANTTFANAFNLKWPWNNEAIKGENSEQRTRLRVTFNYDETVAIPNVVTTP